MGGVCGVSGLSGIGGVMGGVMGGAGGLPPGLPYAFAYLPDGLAALSDGNPIAAWPDASALGVNATQPTSGARPLKQTATNGGRAFAYAAFDGYDDTLTLTIASALAELYIVTRHLQATYYSYGGYVETLSGPRLGNTVESGQTYFHWNPFPAGVRKNGVALTPPYFAHAPLTDWKLLTINLNRVGANGETLTIAQLENSHCNKHEIAVLVGVASVLTSPQRDTLEAWLMSQCGI